MLQVLYNSFSTSHADRLNTAALGRHGAPLRFKRSCSSLSPNAMRSSARDVTAWHPYPCRLSSGTVNRLPARHAGVLGELEVKHILPYSLHAPLGAFFLILARSASPSLCTPVHRHPYRLHLSIRLTRCNRSQCSLVPSFCLWQLFRLLPQLLLRTLLASHSVLTFKMAMSTSSTRTRTPASPA